MNGWEENVRKVIPYVPGEQPKDRNIVKLNTNENPYPPSPLVAEALRNMDSEPFRKYPEATAETLVKALAEYYHVGEDQVFVGVGSDDVLAMCFLAFFNSSKPILFPDITYSFYDVWADLFRIPYEVQPLNESFEIVKEDYLKPNGGIIFANPNAPTGVELPLSEIEEIVAANTDSVVIVDEAYVDFGGESALPLLEKFENLLVVQTFSKSRSLAGMRIGFAIGNPKIIRYLNDVKYSFNSYTMNMPSLTLGKAAINDEAYFRETRTHIMETRERAKEEFRKLGFTFGDSKTNFLFVTNETISAKELFEFLKKKKIFVRYFNKPRINNHLRVTIGTDEEMEQLFAAIREFMED